MKKRTSKEILAETMLELSKDFPVDKITIKKIIEESGVSLKTFYNHFSDKYALMTYIDESEVERLNEKMKNDDYTYHDYLVDGVRYYKKVRQFILNAIRNTSGQDSYEKRHAETFYEAILGFLLKRNHIESIPPEIQFALKFYVAGLVKMYSLVYLYSSGMDENEFVCQCEEIMPEKLKPYLL